MFATIDELVAALGRTTGDMNAPVRIRFKGVTYMVDNVVKDEQGTVYIMVD
jgi:hypothetical protein